MAKIHAYLNFQGNCEEAFRFYERVFNTQSLGWYRFGDTPAAPNITISDADKQKIMHTAIFINSETMLMGSDYLESFGHHLKPGNNAYIMLDTNTAEEAKALHQALTEGDAEIEMDLGEQFYAELFSSFKDQFGICWMIHFEGNKKIQ